MILTHPDRAKAFRAAGLWGDISLVDQLEHWVVSHPDRLALVDAPDHPSPQRVTYGELGHRVTLLSDFLASLSLPADSVAACQMTSSVDTVVFYLACWRVGLIVAPIPPYWRQHEIVTALASIEPKILCASGESIHGGSADRLRDTAADLFSVRYAFGFGEGLPDGFYNLADLVHDSNLTQVDGAPVPADSIATLTWAGTPAAGGEPIVVPRSHNHWLAAATHVLAEIDLPDAPTILTPFALSGLVGIGAGLVPWLQSGGVLHLHEFSSCQQLMRHVGLVGADLLCVPGSLAPAAVRPFAGSSEQTGPKIVAVWKDDMPHRTQTTPANLQVFDLAVLDELGFVLQDRDHGVGPRQLPIGDQDRETSGDAPAAITVSIKAQVHTNEVSGVDSALLSGPARLAGAMVPDAALAKEDQDADIFGSWTDQAGTATTDLTLTLTQASPALGQMSGRRDNACVRHGVAFDAVDLDRLYAGHPEVEAAAAFELATTDAAPQLAVAVVTKDPDAVQYADFCSYLTEQKISPLKIPDALFVVETLPRGESGQVRRTELNSQFQVG